MYVLLLRASMSLHLAPSASQPAIRMDKHEELVVRLHAEIRALQLENQQLRDAAKGQQAEGGAASADGYARRAAAEPNPFLNPADGGQHADSTDVGGGGDGASVSGGLTADGNSEAAEAGTDGQATEAASAAGDIMRDDFTMVRSLGRYFVVHVTAQ